MILTITIVGVPNGQALPRQYTGFVDDKSPPLNWVGAPAGTQAFALICDDPDAPGGVWVHWVVWNIPAASTGLPEGVARAPETPDGMRQGENDFGKIGWDGPTPPPGPAHRYFFRLFALDAPLKLAPGADRRKLLAAMKGHILAEGHVMATCKREE